jgi:uncharacterized protein (TIGR02246 family)
MRVRNWAVAGMAIGLFAGCQPQAETADQAMARMDTESAAAKTAIDSLDGEFATHFNLGHGDMVAALYTADAHLMPPNGSAAVGREAIATALSAFFPMKPQLTLTAETVDANGPLALERGNYKLIFTPPGAKAPSTDTGKYLVHWQRVDGKWMLADDIWNSDLPAAPMGPPAKQ